MNKFDAIIDTFEDGVIVVGADGGVEAINPAACRMLDVESADCGRSFDDVGFSACLKRVIEQTRAEKASVSTEATVSAARGVVLGFSSHYLETDSTVIVFVKDLSKLRLNERNQKEFASNVSHEMRTPIAAVRATAEALLSGAKDDETLVDRFLNTIIEESDRLSALIDELMLLAQADSGTAVSRMSVCKASELIERALVVVRPLAEGKSIEIAVDADSEAAIACDELQIVHVLRNLIDNAVKYTGECGRVEVSAISRDGAVEFLVSDNGMGISAEHLPHIFERFYRVDKGRSRSMGGSGLGLSIASEFVRMHGGEIVVESELGNGSRFVFSILEDIVGA